MIHLDQAVIVEGKYDKITLQNLLDATILPTDGFSIFKDAQKRELIRELAKKCGIVVLTDSDHAGQQIRNYIKNICADGRVYHVYIPQLAGKEKRKTAPSKEGFLGVEGMTADVLENAFCQSGILCRKADKKYPKITKNDLYFIGLSGTEGSAAKRVAFARFAGLPEGFSSNVFLDMINTLFTAEEFFEKVELWHRATDKR